MKILNTIRYAALLAALVAMAHETVVGTSYAQQDSGWIPHAKQGRQDVFGAQIEEQVAEPSIHAETTVVNLDVPVTDQDGVVLSGLERENFRVLDDGNPQTITHFERSSAPITIAMLLEYSGNNYNYFASKAASWGSNFLNHLDPLDWVALVTYDIKPAVRMDFTRNKAEMQQTLSTLSYPQFREANMYDAIVDTLDRLDRVKGKKAILLISTGANTMSSGTLDDTIKRIKESAVTIFSVGIAESEYQRAQLAGNHSISYLQAKNQLETFASLSGGSAWFPRFEAEIPDIFKSVGSFLRNQYSLGFSPKHLVHDGRYHKLKVEIVKPDGTPLIVTNDKGERQKPVVYTREGYTPTGRSHD